MTGTTAIGAFNGAVGLVGELASGATQIKARMDQLTEQSATGLVSQTFGGLGALSKVSLDLRPQIARGDIWQQNITTATTRLDATSNTLEQLRQIATSFYSSLNGVPVQTADGVASLANQANQALGQVQALLNTKIGTSYLLSGEDGANPPVPDATLTPYIQAVKLAASGLASGTGTGTAAATLAIAQTQSPFSATIGGAPTVVPVEEGVSLSVGVVAGQNISGTQTGASTTGSYVRDLLRAIATIGTFSSASPGLGQNFTDLVADTRTSLQGAMTGLTNDVSSIGVTKTQLTACQSSIAARQTALTSQISGVENVDAAATISALTQVQTQLSQSYKLISLAQSMSLVSYL
jgi:flagellar hook-associated protein 3 FlgL